MDEAAGEFDIAEYYRLHIAVERIRFVYAISVSTMLDNTLWLPDGGGWWT